MVSSKPIPVEAAQRLLLGIQGEHLTREITFDFSGWQKQYGNGNIQLQVKRNGESSPYPAPLQVEGSLAVWRIERRDTEKSGEGELQLLYIVGGEQVAKSHRFATCVEPSLSQPGPVPPENQSFGDKVAQDAVRAEKAAIRAEEAAERAENAGGGGGGEPVPGPAGKNGTTFTPSISPEGDLSWTNDGGHPNP